MHPFEEFGNQLPGKVVIVMMVRGQSAKLKACPATLGIAFKVGAGVRLADRCRAAH